MTITEFLLARIAEDEYDALPFRNELGDTAQWQSDEIGGAVRQVGPRAFGLPDLLAKFDTHLESVHVARWDPARVLAECAAKRAIVALHRPIEQLWWPEQAPVEVCEMCDEERWECETILALASVYADHADYARDWAV